MLNLNTAAFWGHLPANIMIRLIDESGNPIDPLDSEDELQMEWMDVMQRSTNPFVERSWHR